MLPMKLDTAQFEQRYFLNFGTYLGKPGRFSLRAGAT